MDFRTGLVNISPAGRHLRHEDERPVWVEFDEKNGVRKKMVAEMKQRFEGWNLQYVIGGQMGFDIFPLGWNKAHCLQFLEEYEQVFFVADKTDIDGNDYPLFTHPRVKGFTTTGVNETTKIATDLFLKEN